MNLVLAEQDVFKAWIRQRFIQRYLIAQMVARELRARYVGSSIGLFWSVIHPLLSMAVFTYVFSYVLRVRFSEDTGVGSFALYLFCGMLPWNSFREIVERCATSITDNASLVKNLSFHSKTLQLSIGITSLVTQWIGLAVLLVVTIILRGSLPYMAPIVLPLSILLMLFGIGLGFLVCTLHVFFRDTAQFVNVGLMIWFYLTPVFYPAHVIPPKFQFLIYINPLAYAANIYRHIVLNNGFPDLFGLSVFTGLSAGTFLLGYWVYSKNFPAFIDEL
ncbi:MAG: ABC transporter permease [Acidobacteria bacterium]|nr:ABC transporter permease [Acidobacteriota bacterium]